ncbi:hypothetical protein IFM89_034282 [Coptis chinensis]|uniref:Protein HGH1 homolog n=1 Tax=Coptis chinensis TaxID=261450 RepID=A0A835IPQ7_9MAGN|nr:hypothetical protein IFM89_034282 [Coptis chinensis]
MATELEELLQFLSFPSLQVKKGAVDIVRDLTGSEDGLQALTYYSQIVFPSLSCLLAENKEISEPAAQALVNLSENSELSIKMIEYEYSPTKKMRAVLPTEISMKEHIWNSSQAGALVASVLQGDLRVLGKAMSLDKIVEPKRKRLATRCC